MNNYIINSLSNIQNTYQSIIAYFYQHIIQNKFTNNTLATYTINYTLLLPSSEYLYNLNDTQVNSQIQAYIDLCNVLIKYINTTDSTQTVLLYEQIQNVLNNSISQLNEFAISLLKAEYSTLFTYTVPYKMSMTNVLFINNINLDTYNQQIPLNPLIMDFNSIQQNTLLNLIRS